MNMLEKIDQLIKQGNTVLLTHRPNSPNAVGPTLDNRSFSNWKILSLSFLEKQYSVNSIHYSEFKEKVQKPYRYCTDIGIGILEAVRQQILVDQPIIISKTDSAIQLIENLCNKFHLIVRQLRQRYNSRVTLSVDDEYDVQDLFHSLLHLNFEDIRPEEWAPSNAGKSTRVDFLLKREKIVVELKKTRNGLGAKEIGSQLIEDIHRYKSHPDCETLLCFVYYPEGKIANPRGLEADLNQSTGSFKVKVIIRP